MNEAAICFTITKDYAQKTLRKLKKCYITSHPDLKEKIWLTKVDTRYIDVNCITDDIIEMYEDIWKIPYIEGINRGDVVTQRQLSDIRDWHTVHEYRTKERSVKNEVSRHT